MGFSECLEGKLNWKGKSMRVAHIFLHMPIGGAEDLSALLLRRPPTGVEIRAVCLRDWGRMGAELRDEGLPITLLPWIHSKRFNPVAIWRLARWL